MPRSAVLTTNIYRLKQSRLEVILVGINVHRSEDGNTETISLGNSLWIEHLLPQLWRTEPEWALPADAEDPTQVALERDHKLHTLGNLTLTTSRLDIGLSNRPWPIKREALSLHSPLPLNRDLVTNPPAVWNEKEIANRGPRLADDFIAIWPHGPALLERF